MPKTIVKPTPPRDEVAFVQLVVSSIKSDRTPYKQYGLELIPQRMLVSIPVPAKEVTVIYKKDAEGQELEGSTDYIVLTLDGLTVLAKTIADSIDTVHNQHIKELQKGLG